jgi:hypothetical protein
MFPTPRRQKNLQISLSHPGSADNSLEAGGGGIRVVDKMRKIADLDKVRRAASKASPQRPLAPVAKGAEAAS